MKNIALNIIAFIIFTGFSNGQKSFSLQESIQYGVKNSNALKIQSLDVIDAKDLLTEYKSIGMPKIKAGVDYSYFVDIPTSIIPDFLSPALYNILFDENLLPRRDITGGSGIPAQFGTKNILTGKLELSTLLFDGSFFVGLKAQKMYTELINRQIGQSVVEIKYQITKAYLAAQSVEANIKIIERNIGNLNKLFKEVNEIYKTGLAEKLDVDRLELSIQNLTIEKEKLERFYQITKRLLKYQMSYPLNDEIILSESFDALVNQSYLDVMDPSIQLNIQNRAEYAVLEQTRQLTEINIKRYKVSYFPSLYGFASVQRSLQRNDLFDGDENKWFPTSIVGLNLSVPIFDGFDRKAKISKAKTLLNRTNLQISEFERGVNLAYDNAKTQYLNALNTYESRKKTLLLAEKIYNTSQIKFKEGVGSSLEVNNAERDMYSAQANVLDAQTNLINAKIDFDKVMGKI